MASDLYTCPTCGRTWELSATEPPPQCLPGDDGIARVLALLRGPSAELISISGCAATSEARRQHLAVIADYIEEHARAAPSDDLSRQWLEWAQEMFGDIALDPKERALRFVEEALELGQAMGIDAATLAKAADRVYSRSAGDPAKEIAQSSATLHTLAYVLRIDPRAAAAAEFDRVRAIPKEEWARRHQAKVDAGFALTQKPAPPDEPTRQELIETLVDAFAPGITRTLQEHLDARDRARSVLSRARKKQ